MRIARPPQRRRVTGATRSTIIQLLVQKKRKKLYLEVSKLSSGFDPRSAVGKNCENRRTQQIAERKGHRVELRMRAIFHIVGATFDIRGSET